MIMMAMAMMMMKAMMMMMMMAMMFTMFIIKIEIMRAITGESTFTFIAIMMVMITAINAWVGF